MTAADQKDLNQSEHAILDFRAPTRAIATHPTQTMAEGIFDAVRA
jgi:hypothetical protein